MDINPFVVFETKLDKDRGIIIVTIRKEETDDVCFFRFHHQPIDCHPEQVQIIIRSHKITARTKSIKVNIYSFLAHYWNETGKFFEFKGVKLNSTEQQTAKIHDSKIKKEVGLLKRRETIAMEQKQTEKLNKIKQKHEAREAEFQLQRAKRIAEALADIKAKKTVDDGHDAEMVNVADNRAKNPVNDNENAKM